MMTQVIFSTLRKMALMLTFSFRSSPSSFAILRGRAELCSLRTLLPFPNFSSFLSSTLRRATTQHAAREQVCHRRSPGRRDGESARAGRREQRCGTQRPATRATGGVPFVE